MAAIAVTAFFACIVLPRATCLWQTATPGGTSMPGKRSCPWAA